MLPRRLYNRGELGEGETEPPSAEPQSSSAGGETTMTCSRPSPEVFCIEHTSKGEADVQQTPHDQFYPNASPLAPKLGTSDTVAEKDWSCARCEMGWSPNVLPLA